MKRKIRNGCFETNSSSVHSLVISSDGLEKSNFKLNKKGKIEIDFGHFGKEFRIYNSQYDKLSYLITCLYYTSNGFNYDSIYDNYEFKKIEDAICKYTGAVGIELLNKTNPEIDHQSQPYQNIEIINTYDENEIINFVFNRYISLRTDCD